MIRVTCLGGAGSVTGSNYLIEDSQGRKVLVVTVKVLPLQLTETKSL